MSGGTSGPAEETRVIGSRVGLDYQETLAFFEQRAERSGGVPRVTVTSYQDDEPDLARRRDEAEWNRIGPLLRLERRPSALDLGCGVGRFARHLHGRVERYLGIDFSPGLVALAGATLAEIGMGESAAVQVGDAADLADLELALAPPFGLVVISGVLTYLNDDDVPRCLAAVHDLAAPDAVLYLREPVGVEARLTLRSHWSEELQAEYSAVYRPAEAYLDWLTSTFGAGWRFAYDAPLDADLRNRRETSQHFWVIDRAAPGG